MHSSYVAEGPGVQSPAFPFLAAGPARFAIRLDATAGIILFHFLSSLLRPQAVLRQFSRRAGDISLRSLSASRGSRYR